MENQNKSTKISDEQLAEITKKVTENYNNNTGIQLTQIEPGKLVITNNGKPKNFLEKELEVIRLFLDSIEITSNLVSKREDNKD